VLLLALVIGCRRDDPEEGLEGKLSWTEDESCTWLHSRSAPSEQSYRVFISGQMENVTASQLEVFSIVWRFSDPTGGMVAEHTYSLRPFTAWSAGDIRGREFSEYYADEVAQYDVIVTDSSGREYVVASGAPCDGGNVTRNLESKIEWVEILRFTSRFRTDVAPEYPYEVDLNGRLVNVSSENVEVSTLIFRFYNQAGEQLSFWDIASDVMRDEVASDVAWQGLLRPGEETGAIFNQFFAEDVARYEVFATDYQGGEYAPLRD
jgi:hypothetical protein